MLDLLKRKIKSYLIKNIRIISRLCRINNKKIVVDNFFGNGYGDNPKYIVNYLIKNYPNIVEIVWFVNDNVNRNNFPNKIRLVKYNSIRAIYELSTAHIWIDNIKNNYKGRKRRGQFYLQTWHGGIGFKKVEKAAEDTLSKNYIRDSKYDSKQIDLMISNSEWVTQNYRNNFWYDGKIVKTGLPRNDVFFNETEKVKEKVKEFYNIDPDTEIILYAPTFRNYISIDEQTKVCSFNYKKVIQAFENRFGKKFVLVKRMHPNVADQIPVIENNSIKDGSRYPDMQELLVASFALITDYSSSVFDFMLKSDKIFIFAKDYEQYIKKDRKIEFNIRKDLPFVFSHNEDELLANINSFNDQGVHEKIIEFEKKVKLLDDGLASQRVSNILIDKIKVN